MDAWLIALICVIVYLGGAVFVYPSVTDSVDEGSGWTGYETTLAVFITLFWPLFLPVMLIFYAPLSAIHEYSVRRHNKRHQNSNAQHLLDKANSFSR